MFVKLDVYLWFFFSLLQTNELQAKNCLAICLIWNPTPYLRLYRYNESKVHLGDWNRWKQSLCPFRLLAFDIKDYYYLIPIFLKYIYRSNSNKSSPKVIRPYFVRMIDLSQPSLLLNFIRWGKKNSMCGLLNPIQT